MDDLDGQLDQFWKQEDEPEIDLGLQPMPTRLPSHMKEAPNHEIGLPSYYLPRHAE